MQWVAILDPQHLACHAHKPAQRSVERDRGAERDAAERARDSERALWRQWQGWRRGHHAGRTDAVPDQGIGVGSLLVAGVVRRVVGDGREALAYLDGTTIGLLGAAVDRVRGRQ